MVHICNPSTWEAEAGGLYILFSVLRQGLKDCTALAVLELNMWTKLVLNLHRFPCLCLPGAEMDGILKCQPELFSEKLCQKTKKQNPQNKTIKPL